MSNTRRRRRCLFGASGKTLIPTCQLATIVLHIACLATSLVLAQPPLGAILQISPSLQANSSSPLSRQQASQPRRHHQYQAVSQAITNLKGSSTNNFLVSAQQQQIAQSLPLTRQTPTQDLDNVIESTTTPVLMAGAKFISASNTNTNNNNQSPPQISMPAAHSLYDSQVQSSQAPTTCQLPPIWAGKWYQANKQEPVRVTNTEISDKGLCRDQKGDKFLFEQFSGSRSICLTCLVINEKHLNVLQYKESSCQPVPSNHFNRSTNNLIIDESDHSLLDSICSDITGDAQLESLFRLDTPSIECPINGQYSFTYDNCRETQSSLDSCIDKKQLYFKFSACPDVPGSESKCKL